MRVCIAVVTALIAGNLFAQVAYPSVIESEGIEFGGVSGTWGHLQYHRPFGMRGIIMLEWKDLTTLNPINGEIINTDRRGWSNLDSSVSYWDQIHPTLVTPQDTLAPSLLVNYKQGDGDFSDFSVWYHNSLGSSTRYGWTSKLRSHQRFLNVTGYYDQRHRLFIQHELKAKLLNVEVNYARHVNPIYVFEYDASSQLEVYRDDYTLYSDRWGGSVELIASDSSDSSSEFFIWIEGGSWEWGGGERNSLSSVAYYSRDLPLGSITQLRFKLGLLSNALGGYSSTRHFIDLIVPFDFTSNLAMDLGLRNIGTSDWLPSVHARLKMGNLGIQYRIHHQIVNQVWMPEFNARSVHLLSSTLDLKVMKPYVGAWLGDSGGTQGTYAGIDLALPWRMTINMEGAQVSGTSDWIWSRQQLKWKVEQTFTLFNHALNGNLRIWGRHLLDPEQGTLDPKTFIVGTLPEDGLSSPAINLLNYTISAQVSKLVLAYTGGNVLQDQTWSTLVDVSWDTEFALMKNQLPDNRFRYLSLIWVFDN
ncbi:MAG: hypothetical protein K9N38_01470 [Candidatus Marinimicrobia bacterium]|nr:hypothetical protein [Candidatus Neomarinimicrobiota bacterium]MCF7850096.1 hypothetical protein [Candidatus Neomarinimicrobiota bacterium]